MAMNLEVADDRSKLLNVSSEILEAIRTKDADAVARHLVQNFVHRTERGQLTSRGEFLSGIAGAPFVIEQLRFESIDVDVFGAVALVTGLQSGRVRLEDGQSVDTRTAFTDLFVRTAAGWHLQAATSVDL